MRFCIAVTAMIRRGCRNDREGPAMTKVLEAASWEGRIFSGGWTTGAGEPIEVLDKATDEVLAVVGSAAPEDVRHAGEMATRAQRDWVQTPGKEKARILRRAAVLFEE